MSTEPTVLSASMFATLADYQAQVAKENAHNEERCELVPSHILIRVLAKRYAREVLDGDDRSPGDTEPLQDGQSLYDLAYDLAQDSGFENLVNDFSDHLDPELCQEVLDEKRRST